jgi:hypothetical protein
MRAAAAIYVAVVLALAARMAARSPEVVTPPSGIAAPRPGFVLNLAGRSAGARVEVSDYDRFRGHHPLYAIDEEANPTLEEKWASLPRRDGRPARFDVLLAAPAAVQWVRLELAGAHEPEAFTQRDFDVACLLRGAEVRRVQVRGNHAPRPRFPVECTADRVRFELPQAAPPLDRARVYEVEVWGAIQ